MTGQEDKQFKTDETGIRHEVNARRTAVFNDRAIAAAYSSPFGTLLLAWIESATAGWSAALAWLALINACELLTLGIGRHFAPQKRDPDTVKAWGNWLVVSELLTGLAWGSSVWFFWSDGHFLAYMFNLTVLVAVSGICVVVMSPMRRGMVLFTGGAATAPTAPEFCFARVRAASGIGAIDPICSGASVRTSRRFAVDPGFAK
ncbi:MAG: hypothetical protein IPJ18_19580 [Betaproteobacteria bacterium]|nr:hypothetical protein [Betaproteobacteria bacterium]